MDQVLTEKAQMAQMAHGIITLPDGLKLESKEAKEAKEATESKKDKSAGKAGVGKAKKIKGANDANEDKCVGKTNKD